MSVIVKGMEMPKNCRICPCFQYDMFDDDIDGYCKALKTKIMNRSKHHPDCPLIELPPHGRLGDLDELYKVANMADDFGADTTDILKLIIDTPTVIEGSET